MSQMSQDHAGHDHTHGMVKQTLRLEAVREVRQRVSPCT
jgi:hypothetical protein